jgi:hypothetical protein
MCTRAGELAAVHDEVLVTNSPTLEPAFQYLIANFSFFAFAILSAVR